MTSHTVFRIGLNAPLEGLAAGMFLGAIIGGMCHFAFDLEMETALFKVAVPTLLTFIPFGFVVLAKRLRQAGII